MPGASGGEFQCHEKCSARDGQDDPPHGETSFLNSASMSSSVKP
ncbi:hypothetical protein Ae168Ps1_5867c [Pseudonocardia sp. Ae168_Ps1]|nr:hypothetical protein Ae168Ps1_5867c [Pseudonocardia sp. Ae168_Ps1]